MRGHRKAVAGQRVRGSLALRLRSRLAWLGQATYADEAAPERQRLKLRLRLAAGLGGSSRLVAKRRDAGRRAEGRNGKSLRLRLGLGLGRSLELCPAESRKAHALRKRDSRKLRLGTRCGRLCGKLRRGLAWLGQATNADNTFPEG